MILQKIKGMPGALFAIIALPFLNFNFHLGKIIDSLQKLQELKIFHRQNRDAKNHQNHTGRLVQ